MNDKKEPKTETKTATIEKATPKRTTAAARTKKEVAGSAAAPRPPAKRAAAPLLRLVETPPEKAFWVNFGPVINSLRGLHHALADGISDRQFTYHTAKGRNDFAQWVEEVLCDPQCATALRRAKTREAAVQAVEAALKRYA